MIYLTFSDKISLDDFYLKATEFRAWLRSHDIYSDELSTDKARSLFKKFVRRWNSGQLKPKFYNRDTCYDGLSQRRTRHTWKIKNESDSNYGKIQEEATEHNVNSRLDKRQQARRRQEQQKEYLEELYPRSTGREAILEKKKAMSRYHNYEADVVPDVADDVLMSGGARSNTDDYQALLERERARRERIAARKQAEISTRLEAYKDKEKKTVEMLLQLADARYGGKSQDTT